VLVEDAVWLPTRGFESFCGVRRECASVDGWLPMLDERSIMLICFGGKDGNVLLSRGELGSAALPAYSMPQYVSRCSIFNPTRERQKIALTKTGSVKD
jgi:hypothetical protein